MNVRHDIINKVEKSLKNSMNLDAKVQRQHVPTHVTFNPTANYRKTHLQANIGYRKDSQYEHFFNLDNYCEDPNYGSFSAIHEYSNKLVISCNNNNTNGYLKFLVALGLNEYFQKYHHVNYLHAVKITCNEVILLITKVSNCGLRDKHNYDFNEVVNSYEGFSNYYSHVANQHDIVKNIVSKYNKGFYYDLYPKNFGIYKNDIICYDPFYYGTFENFDVETIKQLCQQNNIPYRMI